MNEIAEFESLFLDSRAGEAPKRSSASTEGADDQGTEAVASLEQRGLLADRRRYRILHRCARRIEAATDDPRAEPWTRLTNSELNERHDRAEH